MTVSVPLRGEATVVDLVVGVSLAMLVREGVGGGRLSGLNLVEVGVGGRE